MAYPFNFVLFHPLLASRSSLSLSFSLYFSKYRNSHKKSIEQRFFFHFRWVFRVYFAPPHYFISIVCTFPSYIMSFHFVRSSVSICSSFFVHLYVFLASLFAVIRVVHILFNSYMMHTRTKKKYEKKEQRK